MPPKVRQMKAALSKAGFFARSGKESHTIWKHTALPKVRVTISGKDGDDAEPYLVDQVQKALRQLEGKKL